MRRFSFFRRESLPGLLLALSATACSSSDKPGTSTHPKEDGGNGGAASCTPSTYAADDKQADRTACTFEAASVATDTITLTAAEKKLPIEHVIVIMKENRSFDHVFGKLHDSVPDSEPIPADFSNLDADGNTVKPFHLTSTCEPVDPGHQWDAMHAQVNGGKMDGFVTSGHATADHPSDGHFTLGYYDETDLPFYYFLAKTYALADRHFPSVRSGTWANRDYLYLATSDGVKDTGTGIPDPALPTIFTAMTKANVTWGVYADAVPLGLALLWPEEHEGVSKVSALIDGLTSGNLPSVAFVDGSPNYEDEHPPADLQIGEAWTKKIYDAAVNGPLWKSTVIFFTYDEGGGFFDHVPPPDQTCVARPDVPKDAEFSELGIRVPLIAISPWARRHHVSHVRHEHTSITRFIELAFGVPALTKRDANSDALLDLFDFACENTEALPDAPAAGTDGCTPGDAATPAP